MKRGLAVLASTVVFAGYAHAQRAPMRARDIHAVDFQNRVYARVGGRPVCVQEGSWERSAQPGSLGREWLSVARVVYGDLTNDGRDEAAVLLEEGGGGSGRFSVVEVYAMVAGAVQRVGRLPAGDRGDGGVVDVRNVEGRLVVDREGHDTGGALDPEWVETETWALHGAAVLREGVSDRRSYRCTSWLCWMATIGQPIPVNMLPSGDRAVLQGSGTHVEPLTWTLPARPGLELVVDLTRTQSQGALLEVIDVDGRSLGQVAAGQRATFVSTRDGTLRIQELVAPAIYWAELSWVIGPATHGRR